MGRWVKGERGEGGVTWGTRSRKNGLPEPDPIRETDLRTGGLGSTREEEEEEVKRTYRERATSEETDR